jgi:hypothetical protein
VASASDPLSARERAEFDLLRRAESLASGRRGDPSSSTAAPERWTPEEIRNAQLAEGFFEGQMAARESGGFAPKKYANVLSEFEGEVKVEASPATCYALWTDLDALARFVPGVEKALARSPVGEGDFAPVAEVELFYQFGDSRTHPVEQLRFMTTAVEMVPNTSVHWQSTDGFPCGIVATFEPEPETETTVVKVEFYCHLPFELALKEGAMKVSLDVEELLAECLAGFAVLAREVDALPMGVESLKNDSRIVFDASVVPAGFGLDAFREDGASACAKQYREAAERVRARVGRTPFTAEVLKEMTKKL